MSQAQSYAAKGTQKAKDDKDKQKEKRRWVLPIVLLILLILLLLTTFLLIHRLGAYAASELNAIFLVQTDPGFTVEDREQTWGTETRINLFKTEYNGIGRDITVESSNGDRLIAPGTEGEYTFTLKNTGNVAMDYSVGFNVELYVEGDVISLEEFPLGVRLRQYSGEYLLGDGDIWVAISELEDYLAKDTLAVNHYAWYTIEWKWLFEEDAVDDHDRLHINASDELDTLLGNISDETPISLCVSISTLAEPSEDAIANGGITQTSNSHGSILGWFPWILLLLLLAVAITATAFGYACHSRKKQKEEDEDILDEDTETDNAGGDPVV